MSPIDVKAAIDNRDSLAKTLYSRLFDWLVDKINRSVGQDPHAVTMVGVLDIYGTPSQLILPDSRMGACRVGHLADFTDHLQGLTLGRITQPTQPAACLVDGVETSSAADAAILILLYCEHAVKGMQVDPALSPLMMLAFRSVPLKQMMGLPRVQDCANQRQQS